MCNEIIWSATLDGSFECKVTRHDAEYGLLSIVNTKNDHLVGQQVPLLYGAQFGPDAQDVADWQEICEREVDRMQAQEK